MAHAMISILALYNFDDTIFSQMELPEDTDRQTIIDKILIDNAELSMVYTEPETVKMLIGNWSKIHSPNWARIAEALAAEYDPISNYDRHELWTDTGSSSTQQSTGTTRKVAGWNNDSTLTPAEGVDSSGSGSASNTNTRTGRAYGNIGVTTSQQMVTEEVKLRASVTLAEVISKSFKNNFCIQIY